METLTPENLDAWCVRHPQWVPVYPSPAAIAWIKDQGKQRDGYGRGKGWKSKTKDGKSLRFHTYGVAAEWAAMHLYGVRYGRTTGRSRTELNFGDLVGPNDIQIEVKGPMDPYPNRWDLIENEEKFLSFPENSSRPYVCCITALLPQVVLVIGWQWGKQLSLGKLLKHSSVGHGIRVLPWRGLRPPMEMHEALNLPVPKIFGG